MSLHKQRGFSLTELLIALAVGSAMLAGMYGAFVQQQRVSTQQEQLVEARQNARLSMDAMIDEIREAGFDPGGLARDDEDQPARIREANATSLRFTRDLNCNGILAQGDMNEDTAYFFDVGNQVIRRQAFTNGNPAGVPEPLTSNILDLNFCYFLVTAPDGPCKLDPGNPDPTKLNDIRAVQLTLTARVATPDSRYTDLDSNNNKNFPRFSTYRKATLTSIVRLRNLGLKRGDGRNFNEPC